MGKVKQKSIENEKGQACLVDDSGINLFIREKGGLSLDTTVSLSFFFVAWGSPSTIVPC